MPNPSQTSALVSIALLLLVGCRAAPPLPADTPAPTAAPTPLPTPSPVDRPRPLLMAHYMPWYQTPELSGAWGWHWTMNAFDPSQLDVAGRPLIASYQHPLTGPYDSSDEDLLEYQVLLMKVSGIDGVIVDWYGTEPFRDYALLNESTGKLFAFTRRAGLRFTVCYEDQTVMHMVNDGYLAAEDTLPHGQGVMRYLHETWFRDESYLRYAGRPVLFTFGPQYYKAASDWDALFAGLDPRPALVTLDGHTESAGVGSYPWPPMHASTNGVLSPEGLKSYLTLFYARAKAWDYQVAGAFPGFRDIYKDAGVSSEARYLDPQDGETFRFTLEKALAQQPDVVQLITWNDYGETTSIEPTEETGYRYLEMVQEARRAMDEEFPFTAGDLQLPFHLFQLRKVQADDAATQAKLDEAAAALLAWDAAAARAILMVYPVPE